MTSGTDSIALELSQCMVAHLRFASSISKPQLFNWKMCLVSEKAAVFTPYSIIGIAVADCRSFWILRILPTWVSHPACALATAGVCSTPVRHITRVTWHPPAIIALQQQWIKTLILDKLFTVRGDIGEADALLKIRFRVFNISWIRSCLFKSIYQRSVFAVVTMTVTPTPLLSVMSQVTLKGGTRSSPSGSMT